jgi:hypothetical protein
MSYLCAFGKQQEEIIRWWPLYLDDQDCVGKVQLCVNVSMISNNHGTKKVCYRFSKKKKFVLPFFSRSNSKVVRVLPSINQMS